MKWKKQMLLVSSLALTFSLVGCTPAVPKDSYVRGIDQLEQATSYAKNSVIQVDTETKGAWKESETILFSLLNESTIEATSLTNETKGQSETTLHVTGGFDYVPLDSKIHILYDEKSQKTYMEGTTLVDVLAPFMALPSLDKKWVEVGTSKDKEAVTNGFTTLLKLDFSSVLSKVTEEKFIRKTLSAAEKKDGVRDVVTISLTQGEVNQLFPEVTQNANGLTMEGVTLTAYLNRKGQPVKEELITKLIYKQKDKELVAHASMTSVYTDYNEVTMTTTLPKKEDVVPLEAVFENKEKTEK